MAETVVHGCHCLGDMAVRMRKVPDRPWVGVLSVSLAFIVLLKNVWNVQLSYSSLMMCSCIRLARLKFKLTNQDSFAEQMEKELYCPDVVSMALS